MIKNIKAALILAIGAITTLSSCSKWLETEAKDPVSFTQSNKTPEYYEALRAYKQSEHQVMFGWFGNWTGSGSVLQGSLASVPDSVDIVSIWRGNWYPLTEAQKIDMQYVQRVKGTKVLITALAFEVGDKLTPPIPADKVDAYTKAGIASNGHWTKWRREFWGYGTDEESQKKAVVKYANALCDSVFAQGYDGFDFDLEAGFSQPFDVIGELFNERVAHRGTFSHDYEGAYPYLRLFFETIMKRIGPGATTEEGRKKILIVDGEPELVPKALIKNVNYFVLQAYYDGAVPRPDRTQKLVDRFATGADAPLSVAEVCKRIIFTTDHEKYASTGGSPAGQLLTYAAYSPTINGVTYQKGGIGAYHMEYEYTATPAEVVAGYSMKSVLGATYPWYRRAISIMNPVIH